MKAIVKLLAPATLALAAISANAAGLLETDYPVHQPGFTAPAQGAGSADSQYQLSWPQSEAAPVNAAVRSDGSPSREDVMRKAIEPRSFDVGYFA